MCARGLCNEVNTPPCTSPTFKNNLRQLQCFRAVLAHRPDRSRSGPPGHTDSTTRQSEKGASLYRTADPLRSLYAVRTGFFKTCILSMDGREQVTGFQMAGEMLGLDAISADTHACNAIALEDSEVCPLHFNQLERLAGQIPSLQHNLNKIMSREIVRDHGMLLQMGNMNADERLCAFVLNLSMRMSTRGYSPRSF